MKKVFSTNSECAHVWAQQTQEEGKASNLFFEGPRIFSYGYHYCLANFIKKDVVLINSENYSVTTSKHHNYVRRSLHGVKIYYVPSVGWTKYEFNNDIDHKQNIQYFINLIDNNLDKSKRAIKDSFWLFNNALSIFYDLENYCNEFNIIMPIVKPELTEELENRIKKQQQKQFEREEKIRKEKELKNQLIVDLALPAWLNNENFFLYNGENCSTNCVSQLDYCYLRERGGNVYTTRGANVPLRAAKTLFNLINSGKDIKGFQIGSYTVIGINGFLTIGCHKIERSEVYRFAKTQNWI